MQLSLISQWHYQLITLLLIIFVTCTCLQSNDSWKEIVADPSVAILLWFNWALNFLLPVIYTNRSPSNCKYSLYLQSLIAWNHAMSKGRFQCFTTFITSDLTRDNNLQFFGKLLLFPACSWPRFLLWLKLIPASDSQLWRINARLPGECWLLWTEKWMLLLLVEQSSNYAVYSSLFQPCSLGTESNNSTHHPSPGVSSPDQNNQMINIFIVLSKAFI